VRLSRTGLFRDTRFHIARFGNGGGVGDRPADHDLGRAPGPGSTDITAYATTRDRDLYLMLTFA